MRAGHSRNQLNKVTITSASPALLSLSSNWVWLHLFKSTVEERERTVEGRSETEVCQFVQTWWHLKKKRGLPLPRLIKQRFGGVWCLVGQRAGLVSQWLEQANPGLCSHMHNHLWWSQLISSVSGSTDTLCTVVHGHPHRHVTHVHVRRHSSAITTPTVTELPFQCSTYQIHVVTPWFSWQEDFDLKYNIWQQSRES